MTHYTTRTARTFRDKPGWRIITTHQFAPYDSPIHGHRPAGWRWHFEGTAPNGESITGTVHGPYDAELDCLLDAGFPVEWKA